MSLTDYEKYHLHDHVCKKDDVYDKKEVDTKIETVKTEIPTRIFYRGHCKHNNNRSVRFYPNTDIGFGLNVTQSDNIDFICLSSNNEKLLIKNKGLYILTFSDGYKCNQDCHLRLKMDKISHDVNVSSYYIEYLLHNTSNAWKTMSFTTVLEVDDDTNIELFIDNNSAILDGLSYSYITIYRLTE